MLNRRQDWSPVLHISKSHLATYLQCPRRFWFQYVVGQPWEFVPAAVAFGKAIHEAVAFFYEQLALGQTKPPQDAVQTRFRQRWWQALDREPLRFSGDQTNQDLTNLGEALLALFWTEIRPRRIKAVERPFQVDLRNADDKPLDVKLVGIIDLIEEDDEGQIIVSELKTSGKRYSDTQGENQLDGLVYSYAAHELGLGGDDGDAILVRYDVLVNTKQPVLQQVFVPRTESDRMRLVAWIRDVLHAIDSQAFYPNYGWQCQQCPYQNVCWHTPIPVSGNLPNRSA